MGAPLPPPLLDDDDDDEDDEAFDAVLGAPPLDDIVFFDMAMDMSAPPAVALCTVHGD